MPTSYTYAVLSPYDLLLFRFLGPGLGNLLFPWARSIVAARRAGLVPIWPTWPQFKIGPIVRRERDKRFYRDIFRCPPGYLSGGARLGVLLSGRRRDESLAGQARPASGRPVIYTFREIKDGFDPILQDHRFVRGELERMTAAPGLRGLAFEFGRSITVHVRLGDFSAPQSSTPRGAYNVRQPLEWYIDAIGRLRAELGPLAVFVFSDASNDEISALLALPDCHRLDFGSSIGDLLALTRSHVLIASGSTFSMWASFLGRMPTIWYPGQLRRRFQGEDAGLAREIELDIGAAIPGSFLAAVNAAATHGHAER
jgi:hypothetical protein